MSDGHRSGRSTGRVPGKSTELKRCSMIEMRYYYYYYYYFAHQHKAAGRETRLDI